MKNWLEKNYKTLIIAAFLVPIITVAIVSISHVTKWYGISNPLTWSVYLSIGVEIAALSALAAISANMGKKVYFPFAIVTIIQFIGNIFFAYSYIDVNGQSFKDWVGLVSPLVEFMGVEPTDFIGHKRFLAFFAGGMLPIISLSFLHMLVKFTEEDRNNKKENILNKVQENVDSADSNDEENRLKLSQRDLEILEKHLANPGLPNEALKKAAEKYSDQVREKHTHINDFDETSVKPQLTREERGEILAEMMENDQKLGLYDEPFGNPLINPETTSTLNVPETMLTTNQEVIESIPSDNEFADWDVTLMDGLEDESPFFTDEEIENIFQQEPTEEETEQNFSTITPQLTNIFQEEFIPGLSDEEIMEMNQDEYERKMDVEDEFNGFVSEPFDTPEEVTKFNIEDSLNEESYEDKLYEEFEDSDEDDEKKK